MCKENYEIYIYVHNVFLNAETISFKLNLLYIYFLFCYSHFVSWEIKDHIKFFYASAPIFWTVHTQYTTAKRVGK